MRGSKCSIWEGGTRGTGFLSWQGLPPAVKGTTWPGLMHAADWLPTVVTAIDQGELKPSETLPLDGQALWAALLSGGASPRKVIYYGISEKGDGPAVRDVAGNKLITNGDGGGRGTWSPEQLPNASSFETQYPRVRLHIIGNVRNVGKCQSCMVSKLPIICKQTVLQQHKKNGALESSLLL